MMLTLLAIAGIASAAAPTAPAVRLDGPARVGARLVGEAVRDGNIARVYGDTSLSGEVYATVTLPWQLEATVSGGYRRRSGTNVDAQGVASGAATWLWYAPVSAVVSGTVPAGALTLSAGVGPSLVYWAEKPGTGDAARYHGTKWGALVEGGLRAPIGRPLGDVRLEPEEPSALEAALTLGYRWSARRHGDVCGGSSPCGLDLSALRVSVGVQARF
jgi:hypothetical protein